MQDETGLSFSVYLHGNRRMIVMDNCVGENLEIFNRVVQVLSGSTEMTPREVPGLEPPNAGITSPDPETWKRLDEVDETAVEHTHMETQSQVSSQVDEMERPISDSFPDVVLEFGEYAGLTPDEAYQQDGVKAVVALCFGAREIEDDAVREETIRVCKAKIKADIERRDVDNVSTEDVEAFIMLYRPLIIKTFQGVASQEGCNPDEYFTRTDANKHRELYKLLLGGLSNRVAA